MKKNPFGVEKSEETHRGVEKNIWLIVDVLNCCLVMVKE